MPSISDLNLTKFKYIKGIIWIFEVHCVEFLSIKIQQVPRPIFQIQIFRMLEIHFKFKLMNWKRENS